ncbi:MAG: protein kinase [Ktedonobacteraceae bacterium]|nr:protein kinase [Ktedonobacteraceae bacterium]
MQTLPPPVDQLAGRVLGHYDVKQLLGYGNVNAIYATQEQAQDRTVMLTAFTMPETFSPQARERFVTRFTQVASTLVRLDHPSILPTYDFGTQFGYPYLITPFVMGGSLAKVVRQETRCTPERALKIIKQVADGLEYAHQNGIVHGTLKPAAILLDDEQNVRITGFGLATILKIRGIEPIDIPNAHLMSIAGTFLGAPEYVAPEIVQGAPADARSDVYSLGIMLFELLTGKLPFSGTDPFAVAMQHVQQRVPSLQTLSSDVLPGLDLVVQRAVDPDPSQRFQSATKLVNAFARVLEVIHGATSPATVKKEVPLPVSDMTMPPTVNWDEEIFADEQPPMKLTSTGRMPTTTNPRLEASNWQLRPPIVTNQLAAIQATQATPGRNGARRDGVTPVRAVTPMRDKLVQDRSGRDQVGPAAYPVKKAIDPFASWANDSAPIKSMPQPGAFEPETPARVERAPGKPARKKGRRRVVAMLATGVVAAGIVGVGGLEITRFLQLNHAQQTAGNQPVPGAKTTQGNNDVVKPQGAKPQKTMTQAKQKTQAPAKKAPAQKGTVVGMTNQTANTAKAFKNPADNMDSLLVRLDNGTFVAYERACTHQQVAVNYDPVTKKFVCPLHGSIFDPAQNGKVLQGPAGAPLPPVKVSVNGDGTVTVA